MNTSNPGQHSLLNGDAKPSTGTGQLDLSSAALDPSQKPQFQTAGKAQSTETASGRQAATGTMDWMELPGAELAPRQGSSASTPAATSPDSSRAAHLAERIQQLVSHEVAHVKRMNADSLSVVIKPDGRTELLLHVVRRDGQMEAFVRLERGDSQHFQNHWGQLQESLGRQNIRLALWKDHAASDGQSGGTALHPGDDQGAPDHQSSRRQSLFHHIEGEEAHSVRFTSKPRHSPIPGRSSPNPLRGWESWA